MEHAHSLGFQQKKLQEEDELFQAKLPKRESGQAEGQQQLTDGSDRRSRPFKRHQPESNLFSGTLRWGANTNHTDYCEIVPPALPPVPLRFPLRDEVRSHCFNVSFYSYGWISVGHEQRAGISYSSDAFAFGWYRNSHRDAPAQKQLIWEGAQTKKLTMPKETS